MNGPPTLLGKALEALSFPLLESDSFLKASPGNGMERLIESSRSANLLKAIVTYLPTEIGIESMGFKAQLIELKAIGWPG